MITRLVDTTKQHHNIKMHHLDTVSRDNVGKFTNVEMGYNEKPPPFTNAVDGIALKLVEELYVKMHQTVTLSKSIIKEQDVGYQFDNVTMDDPEFDVFINQYSQLPTCVEKGEKN
ncbi:unnamed protein product [Mucor fragilis]